MIEKLINFEENELSKKILLPLFEKIYSCRVAFTGGVYEKGRDIVIYHETPLGQSDVIGVQVKKIRATPNSSNKSFQQLITQLDQLKSEPVICPQTGNKIPVKTRIFITPFEISEKSFDTHPGAFKKIIDDGVTIIDGREIIRLIRKHHPELERVVSGDEAYVGEKLKPNLNNKALLNALYLSNSKNLCDIYCEASINLGFRKIKSNLYYYSSNSNSVNLSPNDIYDAELLNKLCLYTLGYEFYDETVLFEARKSFRLLENLRSKIRHKAGSIASQMSAIRKKLQESRYKRFYPEQLDDEFEKFINSGFRKVTLDDNEFIEFNKELNCIKSQYKNVLKARKDLSNERSKQDDLPNSIDIFVNSEKLAKEFNLHISEISRVESTSHIDSENYLKLTKKIDSALRIINFHSKIFFEQENFVKRSPPKISIDEVFNSRQNVIILGDAGSGKTTNLQIFTKKALEAGDDILTIYLTLSELALHIKKNNGGDIIEGIHSYLNEIGINSYSLESLRNHFTNDRTCLVLDSIDEAIVQYDFILDSLRKFSYFYRSCQIITSSRFTVENLPSLGFVNVSLLPFSPEQKKEFFNKWFHGKNELVEPIISHLKSHPELDEVITNPLSATIMASLQESSIPLPSSEANLYRKRFDLLSGVFDKFKGINRMVSSPDDVLTCSKHIAFKMHQMKKRELPREQIKAIMVDRVSSRLKVDILFDELVAPCEILLVNPNGKYGFGHLRFQEYLASVQLNEVRKASFDKMLKSSWWHDVFLLYSQHAYEIDWLVDYVTNNELSKSTHELINRMIGYRLDSVEKNRLTQQLEIALLREISPDE
ncbi:NACHT domain-containing protein [Alteromonas lipotrueae]|uniref:NACHT domain-containing protein n=1 Tax=Alteromonas lipotrueae TaxID=2803814 RepID=UPI001C467061|nr:NACHT domain-containing protein [Alteromonas lipotrueae]